MSDEVGCVRVGEKSRSVSTSGFARDGKTFYEKIERLNFIPQCLQFYGLIFSSLIISGPFSRVQK